VFGIRISSPLDIDVIENICNSLFVAVGAGIMAMIFGSIAAYVISQRDFWGKSGIMSVLLTWNELVFALTLLNQENFTVPPGLLTFVQGFNTQWNVVAAASILISIPVLIGLAYIQRYFAQGFIGGAVKG
jgi:ABC-type glycerol-3-phosphate transport system permease component